ncbi:MAG: hypothetical protein H6576_06435 [Lewinellaceae bacterium]|nr:hypothetical protein [Lewinellaceae bacterium]
MKKILYSLALLIGLVTAMSAQSPAGFNYQAVVRDAMNQPIANQAVALRLNIREGGTAGNPVYSETHLTNSTDLGVINLIVGRGTVQNGNFSNIDWGSNTYWLEVEMDQNGGSNFQVLGVSQLVSVPYALHAETVSNPDDADADPTNEIQILSKSGSQIFLSHNGGAVDINDADANPTNELQTLSFDPNSNMLSISNGNSVSIPTGGTDADADPTNELQSISKNGNTVTLSNNGGSFTDEVNDADANPTNELQTLSFDPNSNMLSISNGNSVSIPTGGTDADADPTNELQSISKNGNTVTLSNGGGSFTDEVNDADADPTNEIQTISKNGNTVSLSNGGGSFTDEVNDADYDPLNEIQLLFLNGTQLELTGAAPVDLSPILSVDTDDQMLNLSGNTLTIEDGNSVDLSPFASPWLPVPNGILYDEGVVSIKDAMDPANPGTSIHPGLIAASDVSDRGYFLSPVMLKFQQLSSNTSVADMTRTGFDVYAPGAASERGSLYKDQLQIFKDNERSTTSYKNLLFEDTQNGYKSMLDRDSLYLFNPGIGLIPEAEAIVSPFGARFKLGGGFNAANYMQWGAEIIGFEEILNLGSSGLEVVDITNPNNAFQRLALFEDSLVMVNDVKFKNVWMGTDGIYKGGGLKLFSGTGGTPLVTMGHWDPNGELQGIPGGGEVTVYNENGEFSAQLSSIDNRGVLELTGTDSTYLLTSSRWLNMGDLIPVGPSFNILAPRLEAGLDEFRNGSLSMYTNQGDQFAGINYDPQSFFPQIWTSGDFKVKSFDLQSDYARVDGQGMHVLKNDGSPIGVLGYSILGEDGYLDLYDGTTNNYNFYAGQDPNPLACDGCGFAAIYNPLGVEKAGFFIDEFGNGTVFADLKPFRMDHPEQPGKEIWYVAIEGPEAAAYTRGTATLVNGEAFVPFPDHFRNVANPETLTAIVTPLSTDTYGLAVVEKTAEGIRVKELKAGTGSFEFDWEVKGVRKGHENFQVIRDKTNYPKERRAQERGRR